MAAALLKFSESARGNGQVERIMRTIFNRLRATLTVENEKSWVKALEEIQDNINNTVNSRTKFTNSVLHFGTNSRLAATPTFLADAQMSDHFVDPKEAIFDVQANIRDKELENSKQFN